MAFNSMAAKTEKMFRARRELLQMGSHELRTPLARLRFAADLIDANSADAKTNRRMAIIQHSIDDLDTIVSEILEYVQNKEELELRSQEWVDVRRTIEPLSLALAEAISVTPPTLPPNKKAAAARFAQYLKTKTRIKI